MPISFHVYPIHRTDGKQRAVVELILGERVDTGIPQASTGHPHGLVGVLADVHYADQLVPWYHQLLHASLHHLMIIADNQLVTTHT